MINHNQILQTACNDVKLICGESLSKNGIEFFDYARMYDDGSCLILSNNECVIDYLFETKSPVFSPIPAHLINNKFRYFIPEDGQYQKVLHDVRSFFNIAHCFDMFEIHPGYVEVCCFAASSDNHEMINYYFNNVEYLQSFINDFKNQASGLVSELNKNRMTLPDHMRLNFNSTYGSDQNKTSIALTPRQKQCLSYLVKGMTIRDIANELALSPRTVEHYFEAIKAKLGCSSRVELFSRYSEII